MTAATVIPMPRRHGDVYASIPQPDGPSFQVGGCPGGFWAGRPRLSTSRVDARHAPEVIRAVLQAIALDPDADHDLIADLLDVLTLHGYTGDDVA